MPDPATRSRTVLAYEHLARTGKGSDSGAHVQGVAGEVATAYPALTGVKSDPSRSLVAAVCSCPALISTFDVGATGFEPVTSAV
jgi:hypothetical protein